MEPELELELELDFLYRKQNMKISRKRFGSLIFHLSQDVLDFSFFYIFVFKDKLPKHWMRKKVIDGDRHDLRFLDPKGVIVGLVAKGVGRNLNNKFIKAVA